MPLGKDRIAEIYAGRRVKGLYEDKLYEMRDSDEFGFDPKEDWPHLFAKPKFNDAGELIPGETLPGTTALYQGFRNAAEKLNISDKVDVVQRGNTVFVLFTDRCEPMLLEELGISVNGSEDSPSEDTDQSIGAEVVEAS